ncbi:MAG: methyltransferase domain-containing protein [Thermoplasmata archaeon]
MPVSAAVREFDQIAPVYDDTREPLDETTLQRLEEAIVETGCRSILEVGVGTGRIAKPLTDRNFNVTGLDASRAMLARARAKQVPRLVRGNAYHLPFRARSFDGALFVHVLHVFDDPERVLREAARVVRGPVMAIVTKRERLPALPPTTDLERVQDQIRQAFVESGLPPPRRRDPSARDQKLLEGFPPDQSRALSEVTVTEPVARRLDRMEQRADRSTVGLPADKLHEILAKLRVEIGARTITRRSIRSWVAWNSERFMVPAPGRP